MDGIASLLDTISTEQVHRIWEKLQNKCAIPEIRDHIVPHFSWHVAERYKQESLTQTLKNFCEQLGNFQVKTSGLGVFNGEKHVIYLGIVKDKTLLDNHLRIYEAVEPLAINPSPYYSPEHWVPHITLYIEEIFTHLPEDWNSDKTIMCVLEILLKQNFPMNIEVDNLAYGRTVNGMMQVQPYPFKCNSDK